MFCDLQTYSNKSKFCTILYAWGRGGDVNTDAVCTRGWVYFVCARYRCFPVLQYGPQRIWRSTALRMALGRFQWKLTAEVKRPSVKLQQCKQRTHCNI